MVKKQQINIYHQGKFYLFVDLDIRYFIAEDFQKASGKSEMFSMLQQH